VLIPRGRGWEARAWAQASSGAERGVAPHERDLRPPAARASARPPGLPARPVRRLRCRPHAPAIDAGERGPALLCQAGNRRGRRDQPAVHLVVTDPEPWLAELDPDAVAEALQTGGSLRTRPAREIRSGDWVLRFTPVPVDPDKRGKLTGPLVGIGPVETSVSDPTAAIRRALGKKGRRYGAPSLPLVIASAVEELGVETGTLQPRYSAESPRSCPGMGSPVS
jgi:hypothetical protein